MDLMSIFSPAAGNPKLAGQLGSPLLSALLAKHGGGGGQAPADPAALAAVANAAPDTGPASGPAGSPVSQIGDIVGQLSGGSDTAPGSVFDQLPGAPKLDLGADGMDGIKGALTANAAKPRGFLDRIGDFIHSDEGRAALLRSGAATLASGNIGAGIQAGANFVDQRRHERKEDAAAAAAAALGERKFGLDERHESNENAWRLGQLDVQADQNVENRRHNMAGEGNDVYRVDSENRRHATASGDAALRARVDLTNHVTASGDTAARVNEDRYEHDNVSGNVAAQQAGETGRNLLSQNAANRRALLDHLPTRTVRQHYAGSQASQVAPNPAPGPNAEPIRIKGDADYNALPSGAVFIDPTGVRRTKP